MGDGILIDTDVLIDYMHGYPEAVAFVKSLGIRAHLSVITVAEVYAGARAAEMKQLEAVLKLFPQLAVTREIAVCGGAFKNLYARSHALKLGDVLIAATAQQHGLEMATLNVKHYPMFNVSRPYVKQ
jgi:predicted nucleic acid-binding protein